MLWSLRCEKDGRRASGEGGPDVAAPSEGFGLSSFPSNEQSADTTSKNDVFGKSIVLSSNLEAAVSTALISVPKLAKRAEASLVF